MDTIRIGAGAGFSGDRLEPAIDLIKRGSLDYIIFECLAERTIALAQRRRLQNPQAGYDPLFDTRMQAILPALRAGRPRVITNMGAANPIAAAARAAALAGQLGVTGLTIAAVTGDDVLHLLPAYQDAPVLETGKPLRDLPGSIVSANAYLGCVGIVQALQMGADIVITGRVADPALVLGPLVHAFGWPMDDYDLLGKGTLCGHLLECAGQVTGGYFADPGIKDVPDLWNLGFPIAEIGRDGSLAITKLSGTGGLVSEQTCKEQLLYELQDPAAYFTPDCTADFHGAQIRQAGPNRVHISGATGQAGNGQYKVSVGYQDCWIGEGQISYGGATAAARARLAGDIVRRRLQAIGVQPQELRIDLLGVDSLYHGPAASAPPPQEVRLRVAARTQTQEEAQRVANEVESLYTNGPGGGGGVTKDIREVLSIASIFVPLDAAIADVRIWEV